MSRKVQIVNMEAAESERDVVVMTHGGQTHSIRPGRTLDIETGEVIAVSHRDLNVDQEPEPIDEGAITLNEEIDAAKAQLAAANADREVALEGQQGAEKELAALRQELEALKRDMVAPEGMKIADQPLSAEETAGFEDERPFEDGESQKPVAPGPVEEPVTTAENMIGVAPAPTEPEAQA